MGSIACSNKISVIIIMVPDVEKNEKLCITLKKYPYKAPQFSCQAFKLIMLSSTSLQSLRLSFQLSFLFEFIMIFILF